MYTCDKCKKRRKCVKRLTIHRWPPILVLHIKRFSYTAVSRDKINTTVRFPVRGLDLTPYVSDPNGMRLCLCLCLSLVSVLPRFFALT